MPIGKISRIVILSLGLLATITLVFLDLTNTVNVFYDYSLRSLFSTLFLPINFCLVWVGFPIGWNWGIFGYIKDFCNDFLASVFDNGGVGNSGCAAFLVIFVASLYLIPLAAAAVTMSLSIPIAIYQLLTWDDYDYYM